MAGCDSFDNDPIVTADECDSFDNDPIDEEDEIFLEEAMSDTDDNIIVTIDDAHAQSIEPNVVEPLSYLLYWRRFLLLLIFRIALYLEQSI